MWQHMKFNKKPRHNNLIIYEFTQACPAQQTLHTIRYQMWTLKRRNNHNFQAQFNKIHQLAEITSASHVATAANNLRSRKVDF